ncbi:hypothetical protein MMC28_008874 [Mycoblastus sanguinarius]|nr:hypothetical protein [Mycoblastus sanguinarius]
MRLLNSSTLQLEDFPANKIPDYAILSHTWGEDKDEVLFTDMERGSAEGKAGYKKIQYSCKEAADHQHPYIWIDTCCIDKSSSAELSESINSMYSWYQKAKICYAYLNDVPANVNAETPNSPFAKSRWFKRGWTLQELIGPSELVFFSHKWIKIGTKSTLHNVLAEITGINVGILTAVMDLESTSIAKRMSWASHRETTRKEDMAYCLMGLFDINMPLLYGEGEKAFIRLQEEIMRHSDDQSLFAWTDPTAPVDSRHGLLAKSPAEFVNSGNIISYRDSGASSPFSISNKGLRIELHLSPYEEDLYVAALDCPAPPDYEGFLGIYLKHVSTGNHQYARVKPQALCKITARGSIETVYVRQSVLNSGPQDVYPLHAFQLRKGPTEDDGYKLIQVISGQTVSAPNLSSETQRWVPARMRCTFKISKESSRLAGALLLERIDGERLVILLGSTTDFGVGFEVASMFDIENFEKLQKSFNPQTPGTNMVLKDHQVRINTHPRIHGRVKYYMVDIVVEAIYHAPNPIDVIREIIPGLQNQSEECPPNAVETFSRGFGKFKLPFKSSRLQGRSRATVDV